jgi:hypothetical protein
MAAACGESTTPTSPATPGATLTAPAAVSPTDAAQLTTLRPTLTVQNGASNKSGTRTYEFQVSDRADFTSTISTGAFPVLARQTGIAEGAGTTSYTPDYDLQPATRLYWHARIVQSGTASDWSATRSFNTAIVGYNKAGELFDPLNNGTTIGTLVGSGTFLGAQGLRLNDGLSYVRYQLPTTISTGEFSMEIAGLHPNGPGAKLKLFSMSDSTASNYDSPWLFTVQYRGVGGNPDNCISFKMRLADPAFQLEADANDRGKNVYSLNPANYYFFKAMWNDGFRMTIQNGIGGTKFYDLEYKSTDYFDNRLFLYQPTPHYAYLGANDQREGPENGTFPGEIVRGVYLGVKPRPASLGSALASVR